MRRILILVLVACLTLPAEAALAAADPVSSSFTAEVERPPRKKKVKQRTSEWMRMYGKVGLRRHQVTDVEYTSSEGPAPDRTATGAGRAPKQSSFACVKNSGRVIAFKPHSVNMPGRSFSHYWKLFIYKVNKARTLGPKRRWMKQFEFCASGGGHTENQWNANFEGAAISIKDRPDIKLGGNWGETVSDDGGIHASLGFQLSAGVAGINATAPVGIDDDLRFTGSHGSDSRLYVPAEYVDASQVNGYYTSSDDWTFQGTGRWVGNVVHVLYELPQRRRGTLSWVLATKISAHCTKWFQVLGRRCESFD